MLRGWKLISPATFQIPGVVWRKRSSVKICRLGRRTRSPNDLYDERSPLWVPGTSSWSWALVNRSHNCFVSGIKSNGILIFVDRKGHFCPGILKARENWSGSFAYSHTITRVMNHFVRVHFGLFNPLRWSAVWSITYYSTSGFPDTLK